jgi:hypothetical protein
MILKVLGDWEYTPEYLGNKSMKIVFRRLSGKDDLKLSRGDTDDLSERRLAAQIVKIENPFTLEMPDKSKRAMTVEDIYTIPELSPLYYELIVAYADRMRVTDESVKKQGSLSI